VTPSSINALMIIKKLLLSNTGLKIWNANQIRYKKLNKLEIRGKRKFMEREKII
jgi:hypothetical protein|tara:strand:- start:563 stop:724 length:162 start_codon:yes stop_codon:yes gene_type:complete